MTFAGYQATFCVITAALISYEGRQNSFTPGESLGTMQTKANGLVLIGSAPLLAMKL